MPYEYVDKRRAKNPHALPDVEVMYFPAPELQVMAAAEDTIWTEYWRNDGEPNVSTWARGAEGWYYAYGSPGCLWDSDPVGPYVSEEEALAAAREETEE